MSTLLWTVPALLTALAGWWLLRPGQPAAESVQARAVVEPPTPPVPVQAMGRAPAEREPLVDRLRAAEARIRNLEGQAAGYLQQYAVAKDQLKREIRSRQSAQMELAAASAQVSSLLARIHALEMDQGVHRAASTTIIEAVVREAALQTGEPVGPATVRQPGSNDITMLRDEVERWKRHCHLLGQALKQARAQLQRD
ncbi:MAG: hypothetical protein JJT85_06450 [Chromatiales bacterium]|nr:hypothetical protein [Chromatiales bacterium]